MRPRFSFSRAGRAGAGAGAGMLRGATTRTVTLALSLIVALAVIGTLLFIAMRAPATTNADADTPAAPEDIMDILGRGEESGRGMIIQIMDKDDPTRLAAEVLAERYDPDGPSHRLVEQPRAWLFGEDGSSWYIEADHGRFYIPEGEGSPRMGDLRGNVKARRYDPQPGGRPDPSVTPATITATTDEPLHFDLDVLEFETEGRLHVVSDQFEFIGRGVYVVLNEKRESISWLRVDRGERLTYTPGDTSTPASTPTATSAFKTNAGALRAASRPGSHVVRLAALQSTAPKIDLYRAEFKDNVQAVHGSRVVHSDLLTVWTRLIDNKVPQRKPAAGAAGPLPALLAGLAIATPATLPSPTTNADPQPEIETLGTISPAATSATDPVVLTWDGPMEIVPLDNDPAELTMGDHVSLRFEATEGHVEFEDIDDNARGRALTVSYYAQRERIELAGSAGSVGLSSPGAGRISGANSMYIELAAGVVTVPTAGELTGEDHRDTPGDENPQRIAWRSDAMFTFALENGRMTDRIERASFGGDVFGANSDATLEGARVDALFESEVDHDPRLVQLDVEQARGDDGRGGLLSGDALQVHFAPGTHGEDLDPRRVIITGSALARHDDAESIRADRIDATLSRDEGGDIIVTETDANGRVVFNDGKGTEGRGEHIWADALNERAIISGEGARVARLGTAITGEVIELDSPSRSVRVEGSGTFSHAGSDADRGEDVEAGRSIKASWTEQMIFDDLAGRLECVGRAWAESISADGTRDHVDADRIEIALDPYVEDGESEFNNRLHHAVAFGTADKMASVESRRLAVVSPPETPRVDEIFRLEGKQIHLAARDDRLHVPGAGRLFVLDRRPGKNTGSGEPVLGMNGSRGTTLFSWTGSLGFNRRAGEAVFTDAVRVAHKPIDQAVITELFADTLVAHFSTETDDNLAADRGFEGELLWAEALGNALLHVERQREIIADRLLYHAHRGMVEATSDPGNRVEVHDLLRGTSNRSRAIRWDMAEDRIEIINPGSIVAPE